MSKQTFKKPGLFPGTYGKNSGRTGNKIHLISVSEILWTTHGQHQLSFPLCSGPGKYGRESIIDESKALKITCKFCAEKERRISEVPNA